MKGRVLITGPTSGIGRALAKVFAGEGYDLILVSRDVVKLETLSQNLMNQFGVQIQVFAVDLSQTEAVNTFITTCPAIDYLVNNAGIGQREPFLVADSERAAALLQVNLLSILILIKALVPGMVARGRGGILNIASTVAFLPVPNMALYAAGKSFLKSFDASLREELRHTGVTVTTLCPGPTDTAFNASIGIRVTKWTKMVFMSPEKVARVGFRGLLAGKSIIIPGFWNQLGRFVSCLIPNGLLARMVVKLQKHI